MEELSFVPSAVSEPRLGLAQVEVQSMRLTSATNVTMKGRLKQGEAEMAPSKWRALVEQRASRGKLWAAIGLKQLLSRMWE